MSHRVIADFLKTGDAGPDGAPGALPRRRGYGHLIGRGFPEARPMQRIGTLDPQSAAAQAWRDWAEHVAAGRIGGGGGEGEND